MALSQRRARLVRRLRIRKSREREGRVLVEGVRAAAEALAAAVIDFAVVSPKLDTSAEGRRLHERLAPLALHAVTDGELEDLSDTDRPQGVLIVCREPVAALADLPGRGGLLLLDAVQDPGNVGTLLRSAVAFGLCGVVCLDGTVDPWSPKVVRASAGTVFRMPVVRTELDELTAWLADGTRPLLAASVGGMPVGRWLREKVAHREDTVADGSFALALGNEGAGVRPRLGAAADATIGIGMRGPAESLNVAIAGSILMYELTRASDATPAARPDSSTHGDTPAEPT